LIDPYSFKSAGRTHRNGENGNTIGLLGGFYLIGGFGGRICAFVWVKE
jgi:hypothetical protein